MDRDYIKLCAEMAYNEVIIEAVLNEEVLQEDASSIKEKIRKLINGFITFCKSIKNKIINFIKNKILHFKNKENEINNENISDKNDQSISDDFVKAVNDKKITRIKIMLKDSLLYDKSFESFNKMLNYLNNNLSESIFQNHDNEEFLPSDKWNEDYLNEQLVKLINNFSKERVQLIKQIIKKIYFDQKHEAASIYSSSSNPINWNYIYSQLYSDLVNSIDNGLTNLNNFYLYIIKEISDILSNKYTKSQYDEIVTKIKNKASLLYFYNGKIGSEEIVESILSDNPGNTIKQVFDKFVNQNKNNNSEINIKGSIEDSAFNLLIKRIENLSEPKESDFIKVFDKEDMDQFALTYIKDIFNLYNTVYKNFIQYYIKISSIIFIIIEGVRFNKFQR